MPFDILETVTNLDKVRQPSISYTRNTTKAAAKAADRKPKLIVGVPIRLAAEFKYREGSVYRLQVGKGTDAGKIRIAPIPANATAAAKSNGITPTVFKHGLVFRFGYVPLLGDSAAAKENVHGEVLEGGILQLDAPAWFKPD